MNNLRIQDCLFGPYYPINGTWIGDFEPLKTAPNTAEFGHIKTNKEVIQFIQEPRPKTYPSSDLFVGKTNFDKQVWFKQGDGGYIFELEVPRYSKEEISVTIEENTICVFGEKKVGKNSLCFTEKYDIPYESNLNLENCLAKVEDGLLSIAFPKKFVAPKTIKIL